MLKFDNELLQEAQIVIDGSGDRAFKREMGAYFRRQLGTDKIKSIAFNDSQSDRLVQLADMCAGAIARSYKADRHDRNRRRDVLHSKIEDIWNFR
jgi:hypothetical protein